MVSNPTADDGWENELSEQTDGALRVARRQMIQSAVLAKKAEDRLNLQEHGDFTRQGVGNKVTANVASGFQAAEDIADELDRRGADYKSRAEVASSL